MSLRRGALPVERHRVLLDAAVARAFPHDNELQLAAIPDVNGLGGAAAATMP